MTTASTALTPGTRVPMPWEQYLATRDNSLTEYIDGAAVMSPLPTIRHGIIVAEVILTVQPLLPSGYRLVTGSAWKPSADEFGPDLLIVPPDTALDRFTGIPAMVGEVVSSNRGDDLVEKMQKYARVGAPQYWLFDPRDREIIGLELRNDIYAEYVRVDEGNRSGEFRIPLGEGVRVPLGFEQFFA